MTRDEIFETWAPAGATWCGWVKPALFAHLPREFAPAAEGAMPDVSWAPPSADRVAVVIDLPGAASVRCGLALAALGYRPVPLFNAIPPPPPEGVPVVNVEPILAALQQGADRLRQLSLPADAPPAFLVDADRQATHSAPSPGAFDNRSVVFVTDFPSAALLASHGITRAVLVRESSAGLGDDLRFALQTWQKAGLQLSAKWLSEPGGAKPLTLPRTGWLAGLWWRLKILCRFRQNAAGEFGTFVPVAGAG